MFFLFTVGQGVYTLMVMKPKQEREMDDFRPPGVGPSSNVDSSKSLEKDVPAHHRHSDSELGCISEDKTASSDCDPKHSKVESPFSEFSLSESFVLPSLLAEGENKAGIRLCFKPMRPVPASVGSNSNPSPKPSNPRGRPQRNMVRLMRKEVKQDADRKLKKTEVKSGADPEVVGKVTDRPAPVRRRRGRPPKNKTAQRQHPPSEREAGSPSNSKDDSPVRFSAGSLRKRDSENLERPLTRGSLGKDFPSEKKRSWLDVERALEPELEF